MKRNYLAKANKIEAIHIIVFVITIFTMFFLFSSNILILYSAIWIVGLWGVDHMLDRELKKLNSFLDFYIKPLI